MTLADIDSLSSSLQCIILETIELNITKKKKSSFSYNKREKQKVHLAT